jgi:hypothetical protein
MAGWVVKKEQAITPTPAAPAGSAGKWKVKQERDVLKMALMPSEAGFNSGIAVVGPLEIAGSMATGAAVEVPAGIAGLAKTITSGPIEGEKTMNEIRDFFTYEPKTDEGKAMMQGIGEIIQPVAKTVEKIPNYLGDKVYDKAGEIPAAATQTLIRAIPEIVGLKGTRTLRKFGLKRILKDTDVAAVFDEAGNLRKEVIDAAAKAGIDANEVVNEMGLRQQVKQINKAAGSNKALPSARIAVASKPDPAILKAADDFGVSDNLLASHASKNPTYRAIEQGLKSVPGSQLAAKERALILDVSTKADDLIQEFGGTLDKASLADSYRLKAERVIKDLEDQAETVYDRINKAIPGNAVIDTQNTYGKLLETIDELGGRQYLSPKEGKLLRDLDPRTDPTYSRLDKIRKEIGQALGKNTGMFKDSETGLLKQLYKALSEDQLKAAKNFNVGELYDTAKDLVSSRKIIENQMTQTLGKNLTGAITTKAKQAMLNLSRGDTKTFDELLSNIPEQMGAEMKKSVIATALNDAFTQGSRAEKSLNIAGFDDFMTGLKRNKTAYERLKNELGSNAMKRMESFHTLVAGIRRAQKDAITTGRVMAVPALFDETNGLAAKLYGAGKTILPETIGTISGAPGLATATRLSIGKVKKVARSHAADELLASDKFQRAVRDAVVEAVDEKKINDIIKSIPAYKRWAKTLAESEAADLAAVGAIGWLSGFNHDKGKANNESTPFNEPPAAIPAKPSPPIEQPTPDDLNEMPGFKIEDIPSDLRLELNDDVLGKRTPLARKEYSKVVNTRDKLTKLMDCIGAM